MLCLIGREASTLVGLRARRKGRRERGSAVGSVCGQYQDNYDVERPDMALYRLSRRSVENNVALVLSGMRTCKDVFAKLK